MEIVTPSKVQKLFIDMLAIVTACSIALHSRQLSMVTRF